MTSDARRLIGRRVRQRHDRLDDFLMAMEAGLLRHAAVASLDSDRVGKFSSGEGKRMPEAVIRFGHVLADEIMRRMTIVAGGDGAMARFDPSIEMILHDMVVRAGGGVVRQVGGSFGVNKREPSDAQRDPERNPDQRTLNDSHLHLPPKV